MIIRTRTLIREIVVIIVCNAGYTINLYMMYLFRHEEEMYRLVITDYEERQKQLMVENTELRSCLNNMQKELVQLLNEPSVPSNGSQVNKTKVFFFWLSGCEHILQAVNCPNIWQGMHIPATLTYMWPS